MDTINMTEGKINNNKYKVYAKIEYKFNQDIILPTAQNLFHYMYLKIVYVFEKYILSIVCNRKDKFNCGHYYKPLLSPAGVGKII